MKILGRILRFLWTFNTGCLLHKAIFRTDSMDVFFWALLVTNGLCAIGSLIEDINEQRKKVSQ